MQFESFVEESRDWWDAYFRHIKQLDKEGRLYPKDRKFLYPNIIVATQCKGYYLVELMGAVRSYSTLVTKRHREDSIYRYLSQFDDGEPNPVVTFDSSNNALRFLCLSQKGMRDSALARFPHLELYQTKVRNVDGHGSVLAFGDKFRSCAIENCVLVNTRDQLVRCKGILWLGILRNSVTRSELVDLFVKVTESGEIKGVHPTTRQRDARLTLAGQLQSMYLFPNLRETTLGEFFKLHPDVIKLAFKTDCFKYEPYLEWIEHDGTVTDEAINPDLLVQRPDGFFDIYDLKTALLDITRITKGARNRRRFIEYVEEGVSQLANYREYFRYPRNAAYAKDKYNVVVENPKLVLVVGTFDNVDINEVEQACRKYKNVEIVDYDTLCQMFMGSPQDNDP